MAGSTWHTFTPGTVAKSSEVNENFDWLEGSLAPMVGGSMTTAIYDLGTTTAAWRNLYLSGNIVLGGDTITSFDGTSIEATNGVVSVRTSGITAAKIANAHALTAYMYSATSVTFALSATAQIIPFNIELFDLGSEWNGSRFVANSAGYYEVNCNVGMINNNAAGFYRIFLRKNSGSTQFMTFNNTTGVAQITASLNGIFQLNAADFLEVFGSGGGSGATGPSIAQGSSVDSSVTTDGPQTWISIRRIV